MNYNKAYPSVHLMPYIKYYWGMEPPLTNVEAYRHKVIPTGLPELIFYLGYKPETSLNRNFEDYGILNIQQNDHYDLIVSQGLRIFAIYFQPEAVSLFFNLPLNQFLNAGLSLSQLTSNLANELQEQLCSAISFEERRIIVENYFSKLLSHKQEDADFKRMQRLIALISHSRGQISIDKLVDESCLSRKQFERKFSAQIGISPKQYLKIICFQSVIHQHSIYPNRNLTELAYNHGYYDQSHFISDVKSFTGESPKQVFKESDIISDYFDFG